MEWFTGPIPEGINASKNNNKLFVVFIHDSTEASTNLESTINGCGKTLSETAVAIKLENESTQAKQFAQIFPINSVPSLFFILPTKGSTLDVISSPVSTEELLSKIKDFKAKNFPSSPPEVLAASSSVAEETSTVCEGNVCKVVPKEESSNGSKETTIDKDTNEEGTSSPVTSTSLTLNDRIERAKILAQQKQMEKENERKDKEISDEIKRREMGKEMRRIKREQEEKEMKEMIDKRKKEKLEDMIARERVKAQIAADKEERERRAALLRGDAPAAPENPVPSVSAYKPPSDGICRLKLKLPCGTSSVAQFQSTDTLAVVYQHVDLNVLKSFKKFKLATTLLQKNYTAEDMDKTLVELKLAPTAIISIMPTNIDSSPVASVPYRSFIDSIIWIFITPVTSMYNYVRNFIFGAPNQSATSQRSTGDSIPSEINRRSDRPKTAYGNRRRDDQSDLRYRREGNVHRLGGDTGDDSDDNNTWNGNSTQQM